MPVPAPPQVPAPASRLLSRVRRGLRAKDVLVIAALAAIALQARTEGGGSGPVRTAATRPAAASPSAAGDVPPLVAEVAPPSYADGSIERAVFEALNQARARGNFGLLAQDARLDAAAAGHATYIAQNLNGALSHRQDARQPGFSGETPLARVRAAGYDTSVAFEAISSGATAPACLELLNTVYHLGSLMVGATDVGIAVEPRAGCVIETQLPGRSPRPQRRPAGTVGTYPYPGQMGVPAAFMPATEMPNPAPDVGDALLGPPILVDLDSAAAGGLAPSDIVLGRFTLAEAGGGAPVAARVLAHPSVAAAPGGGLDLRGERRLASAGHVFLLPMHALKPQTAYAVDFSGSVRGQPVSRRWDFSTR